MNDKTHGGPKWSSRPALIDADLTKEMPWASIRGVGYSNKFELAAPVQVTHISYSEHPQHLYVTGTRSDSIHSFWFAKGGGTGEFDLVNSKLTHLDFHSCDISISGSTLIVGPCRPGGSRLLMGPQRDLPRNSEELFLAALKGYRPEGWEGDSK